MGFEFYFSLFQIIFVLALIAIGAFVFILMRKATSVSSEWKELESDFPVRFKPEKTMGVTGKIGTFFTKGAYGIGWNSDGIYIAVNEFVNFGSKAAIQLPWDELELLHSIDDDGCIRTEILVKRFPSTVISMCMFIDKDSGIDEGANAPTKLQIISVRLLKTWCALFTLFIASMLLLSVDKEYFHKEWNANIAPFGIGFAILLAILFLTIIITAVLGEKQREKAIFDYPANKK
ncbi:MAG: hypothetical protein KAG97_03965 [Victivallales bacterium]|nr:hypothetical protein [Victivallales bacterium]